MNSKCWLGAQMMSLLINNINFPALKNLLTDSVVLDTVEGEQSGADAAGDWLEKTISSLADSDDVELTAEAVISEEQPAVLVWRVAKGGDADRAALIIWQEAEGHNLASVLKYTTDEATLSAAALARVPGLGSPLKFDSYHCVREVAEAYSEEGGLTILYGNLAPEGSVVKTAGVDPKMLVHEGPAVIFENQEDACNGILNGKVKAGDVVVIRYEGPRGGPGMQEMLAPTSYIKGMDLGDKCALLTDGRFSGGTAGACIGHVSPEAAECGPIALVREGDIISLDIPNKSLDVKVDDATLEERKKDWTPPPKRMNFGWLKRYQSMVTNASKGAVLRIDE
jgi:dihydroxy-acid dehydratase